MAEKGIIVEDDGTGESIACRDAVVDDDEANARIIQLVDMAPRPITYSGQPVDTLRDGAAVSDDNDISPLASDLLSNFITVSDCSHFIMYGRIICGSTAVGTPTEWVVSPIIMSEEATKQAVCHLPPVRMRGVSPSASVSETDVEAFLHVANGGSKEYLTNIVCMPTFGAKYITFHFHFMGNLTGVNYRFYAFPTSQGGNGAIHHEHMATGEFGAQFFPCNAS